MNAGRHYTSDCDFEGERCFRCGRIGHFAAECFARTTFDYRLLDEDDEDCDENPAYQVKCWKCGRLGHYANECFAKSSLGGVPLSDGPKNSRCHRCGRPGHFAIDCFARSTVDGSALLDASDMQASDNTLRRCCRCGRFGHAESSCFAKHDVHGLRITTSSQRAAATSSAKKSSARAGVYVLRNPSSDEYYIGKSIDIDRRIQQHRAAAATGGRATDFYEIPPETDGDPADMEAWERSETLHRMRAHGLARVRGWGFTARGPLPAEQARAAFAQVCERFDLCRRCGRDVHFVRQCAESTLAPWAAGAGLTL